LTLLHHHMPLINDRASAIRRLEQQEGAVPQWLPEWCTCSCCPRPLTLEHSQLPSPRMGILRLRCPAGNGIDVSTELQLPPPERKNTLKLRAADLWKGVRQAMVNHAAKHIQVKWRRHSKRKRSASKIQRLWRNRSESSLSTTSRQRSDTTVTTLSRSQGRFATFDFSADTERSMRPRRFRRKTTLSVAVDAAASRIQKLWRHRDRTTSAGSLRSVRCSSTMTEMTPREDSEAVAEKPFKRAFTVSSPWDLSSSSGTIWVDPAGGAAPLLRAWWEDRKKRALEHLVLQTAGPVLKRTLHDIGDVVKTSVTSDPDMWRCVRPFAHTAMSEVWNDIQIEIESSIKDAVVVDQEEVPEEYPTARGCLCCLFLWMRSWVLFHYLPYNRSIYGKLADPIYVLMTLSTFLPVFGIRVFFFSAILLMLLFPGPPDEYQLINFILIFKGTLFFTVGVAMMFIGAMRYYACYLFDGGDLRRCIDVNGPGSSDWLSSGIFDYIGSIVLVWIAFLALPLSSVHLSGNRKTSEHEVKVYCCCLRGVPTRGGRLRWLLRYDMVAFALSLATYVPIYMVKSGESQDENRRHPQQALLHAKETVYWCRILYSLLSLPFVLFAVPLCGRVLTHSVYTGYNEFGACVEFRYREPTEGKFR